MSTRPTVSFTTARDDYAAILRAAERTAYGYFGDDDWEFTSFKAHPLVQCVDGHIYGWQAFIEATSTRPG